MAIAANKLFAMNITICDGLATFSGKISLHSTNEQLTKLRTYEINLTKSN